MLTFALFRTRRSIFGQNNSHRCSQPSLQNQENPRIRSRLARWTFLCVPPSLPPLSLLYLLCKLKWLRLSVLNVLDHMLIVRLKYSVWPQNGVYTCVVTTEACPTPAHMYYQYTPIIISLSLSLPLPLCCMHT